jgi:hypothetical protein
MKRGRDKTAVLNGRPQRRSRPISKLLAPSRVFVPKPRAVAGYLSAFPRLRQLLPELCAKVRASLGAEVEISLEVYSDPEIDDRYLTLYVRQPEYDTGFLRRVEALREQTNPQLERVPGYLLLMTDFRRPRTRLAI